MPRIGFLHNRTKASFQKHFAAFVGRLYDFVEEADVIIVERWAGDDPGKSLEKHAADSANDMVRLQSRQLLHRGSHHEESQEAG